MTLEFGLFPLAGLVVAAALYAVERWVLRLKCGARWAQAFIAVALLLTTLCSAVTLSRVGQGPVPLVDVESTIVPLPSWNGADHENLKEVTTVELQSPSPAPVPDGMLHTAASSLSRNGIDVTLLFADALPMVGPIYIIGVVAVVLYFLGQIVLLCLYRKRQEQTDTTGIYLTDSSEPFSFGRSIFLPRSLGDDVRRYVLLHEQAHLHHRHFLKLCALQLLAAFNWYNPFAWLLFGEMRLQQELEVDGDVLRTGVDRQYYQLALLSVCAGQPGKWILLHSTFRLQPLKQRIIFMNTDMNKPSMRRRQTAAAMLTVLVMAVAAVIGCQTHVQEPEVKHHPMRGCWTMDWISNTGSGIEVHPAAMHYGFYNDSTFLCYSYWSKQGVNIFFSISGEGYSWRGDTLACADGRPTDYTFIDEHTAISRWMKDSTQKTGVSGPDITEQWHSIQPNPDIVTVFRAVVEAHENEARPMDGVWVRETPASEGQKQTYCLINDTIFMQVNWNPSTVVEGFRYAGSGVSASLAKVSELISQPDADHIVLSDDVGEPRGTYRRIPMPDYLLRAFAPAAYIDAVCPSPLHGD